MLLQIQMKDDQEIIMIGMVWLSSSDCNSDSLGRQQWLKIKNPGFGQSYSREGNGLYFFPWTIL
jgi:hypothetical protein